MKTFKICILFTYFVLLCNCSSPPARTTPPELRQSPQSLKLHGDTRPDEYNWVRDRKSTEIIEYLNEENKYTEYQLNKITKNLRGTIFEELKARINPEDEGLPIKHNDYYYFKVYKKSKEYPYIYRYKTKKAEAELIFDQNKMANNQKYFRMGSYKVTEDNKIVAYAIDRLGDRKYTVFFKNLSSKQILPFKIENVTSNGVWANDNKTFFYTKFEDKTIRWNKIFKFDIETKVHSLVYEEKDKEFYSSVWKTKTKKYIVISSGSRISSESQLLNANDISEPIKMFSKRKKDNLYDISDGGDRFFVRTNKNAVNFKIETVSKIKTDSKYWKPFVKHNPKTLISSLDVFKKYVVLGVESQGLQYLKVYNRKTHKSHRIEVPEKISLSYAFKNNDFEQELFRFGYESPVTPNSIFDYNLNTKAKTLLKEQKVLGGYDKNNYRVTRKTIKVRDGKYVPVTLFYHKDMKLGEKSYPMYLNGYGSYAYTRKPYFASSLASLADRKIIYAIAHVRGSSVNGRQWYYDGRMLKKKNTFNDFVDVAEYFVKHKYTSSDHLFAEGRSAGGLLMGAIVNMKPELFKGVIAGVPFVDVISTMLDESLPLTTNEYSEWGNPNIKKYYTYMKSYSPYDNVQKKPYPTMLITSGLHDSQVQFWEPTKWTARLRQNTTSKNPILLYTEMSTGHGGKSGRFARLEQKAMMYAFVIGLLNENHNKPIAP